MALSDKDIAKLYTKLELPIVVGDALSEQHMLAPDEEFAFHQALSDMQPDAALICMALASEQIFATVAPDMPEAVNLIMESDRVVASYGGLWLARIEYGEPVPEEFIIDALKSLPKDFAAMRDAMSDLELQMPAGMDVAAQFLAIMQIQAECHSLIAESYLEALGITPTPTEKGDLFHIGATANDNIEASVLPT
ncbi:MAG: hypothetical protein EOM26_05300 [Alphaproteobacteria bacterium]|nr:hypothetical protein [Alphaproteobacteria bacterium]